MPKDTLTVPELEIDITPEMIAEGKHEFISNYDPGDWPGTFDLTIIEIFKAMLEASQIPARVRGMSLQPPT